MALRAVFYNYCVQISTAPYKINVEPDVSDVLYVERCYVTVSFGCVAAKFSVYSCEGLS